MGNDLHTPINNELALSIIIVVFDMVRAAPRSIQSLTSDYQQGMNAEDYEILVIENGSNEPLNKEEILSLGSNIRYFYLENPPPSPAYAINYAVKQARGDVISLMVDGAHMLTPGVLRYSMDMFRSLKNPLVVAPQFFLGPGPQMETIFKGYNESVEDGLLKGIAWPEDGYRLFEIGEPYRVAPKGKRPKLFWFVRLFESNCLFFRKESFQRVGGCDERFDIPGGGILLPDLYRQLTRLEDTEIVQLIGEASFHQLHGGVSTNTTIEDQKLKWESYLQQYLLVRGESYQVSDKAIKYYGHMPNQHARRLMITG